MGALRSPDLIDCILCDHSSTLTLFNTFFSASGARWHLEQRLRMR